MGIVWALASQYPESALREGLRLASAKANSLGITSTTDAVVRDFHWRAYLAAEQAEELTLRIKAARWVQPFFELEELSAISSERTEHPGLLEFDSTKLFVDGDLFSRNASLLEPYANGESFDGTFFGDSLAPAISAIDAAGLDIHIHAYGDAAVRHTLDAIERAIRANPARDRRHQLAHVALIHPDDLPRFAELGVAANIQPFWGYMNDERHEECEILGNSRCNELLRFHDLFESGARVTAGSDWISESMSPLYSIQVAVTRRPPDGSSAAWNPGQTITLEQMIRAYTIDAAWQARQEHLTGSVEPGKAADLILLKKNLLKWTRFKSKMWMFF